jgi:hypothetical protein
MTGQGMRETRQNTGNDRGKGKKEDRTDDMG